MTPPPGDLQTAPFRAGRNEAIFVTADTVLCQLRDEAESYRNVGREAARDGRGRASSRYGRRAERLDSAVNLIEALIALIDRERAFYVRHHKQGADQGVGAGDSATASDTASAQLQAETRSPSCE